MLARDLVWRLYQAVVDEQLPEDAWEAEQDELLDRLLEVTEVDDDAEAVLVPQRVADP